MVAYSARALPRIAVAFPKVSHVIMRSDVRRIHTRLRPNSATQIIAALAMLSIPSVAMAQVCPRAASANNQIVKYFPPKTVKHPKGQTGDSAAGGLMLRVPLTPANEYYLDFAVWYGPFDWESGHSGKIPGLAGGDDNAGCKPVHPRGWSARQHFFLAVLLTRIFTIKTERELVAINFHGEKEVAQSSSSPNIEFIV